MFFALEVFFFVVGVFMQFVLEVLGAGGAIWGMSEVWHMRGGTNPRDALAVNAWPAATDMRWAANTVFCLGFIRFFFRYGPANSFQQALVDPHEWLKDGGKKRRAQGAGYSDDGMFALEIPFFILGVFLQWVLEVLGAGGATWGMSEVWHLRGDTSYDAAKCNNDFRWVANVVFSMGIIRMLQKYCPDHGVHKAMLGPQDWLKTLGEEPKQGRQQGNEMI